MIPETAPSRLSSTAKRMNFQVFLAVAVAILFPFPGLGQANSSGMFPLLFADFCGGVSDHPPILSGIFAAFFAFLALALLIMGLAGLFGKKRAELRSFSRVRSFFPTLRLLFRPSSIRPSPSKPGSSSGSWDFSPMPAHLSLTLFPLGPAGTARTYSSRKWSSTPSSMLPASWPSCFLLPS